MDDLIHIDSKFTVKALALWNATENLTLPVLALAFALFTLVVTWNNPPKQPTMPVGYGCEGSDGKPLYFPEEDMFPNCSLIERATR